MQQKKLYLAIFFLAFVFLVSPSISLAEGVCFRPEFPIPGFPLDPSGDCKGGMILSSQGDAIILYVNALYKYGAGLAGLMAMFMIVFAAWQWIMASGNAGKIDNAKDTIRGALLGLTLLFAGNLLLGNITNRLVSFNGLSINNITTQQLKSMSFDICPNTIYIPCGSVSTSTGARCVGSKCQANSECRTVVDGLPTRDFCNPDSLLSCTCVPDDYEYPVAHTCSSFSGTGNRNACLNDSTATDGPCRWDTDLGFTCKNILSGSCGSNDECITYSSEDPNTSAYCCCNDSLLVDSCALRSNCSSCN
ncbi:hypothetical protein KBC40_00735 [Patescibacteria group bacterium]|nr:hypothetical protein [Patescibacteria group bacterium]